MENKYLSFLGSYKNVIGNVEGVSIAIVKSIEDNFNVSLPVSYKEYLFLSGRKSGNLLSSYYTEYPALLENRNDAIKAVNFDDRRSERVLIKNSFFFAQWQGYIFYFFDCEEPDDNPPIYILSDGLKIEKYKDSFTDFVYEDGLKPLMALNNL